MHRDTVLVWCDNGTLAAVMVGARWRIAAEDIWPLVPPGIRATWVAGPWSVERLRHTVRGRADRSLVIEAGDP